MLTIYGLLIDFEAFECFRYSAKSLLLGSKSRSLQTTNPIKLELLRRGQNEDFGKERLLQGLKVIVGKIVFSSVTVNLDFIKQKLEDHRRAKTLIIEEEAEFQLKRGIFLTDNNIN